MPPSRVRASACFALGMVTAASAGFLRAQQAVASPPPVQNGSSTIAPGSVLHVSTREVVVDLLARDRHDQPVTNLAAEELQVFELDAKHTDVAQHITSLRLVPAQMGEGASASASSLHVQLGSGCAENATAHYELTYRVGAEQMRDGEHRLVVTSTRPHLALRYGTHYFVAGTEPLAQKQNPAADEAQLLGAACLHSRDPL